MFRVTLEFWRILGMQLLGEQTPEDLAVVDAIMVSPIIRSSKFVAISDVRHQHKSASQRALLAEWSERRSAVDKGRSLRAVLVLGSPALRAGLTALNWLVKRTIPQEVVASAAEAVSLGITILDQANLDAPDDVTLRFMDWIAQGGVEGAAGMAARSARG